MNEQMREYFKLKNRIKVWFIYNHGLKDDEDLDYMIDEVTFFCMKPGNQSHLV